jgi:MFS family permease
MSQQPSELLSHHDRRAYERNIWLSYAFTFLHSFQLWWPIWVIYLTDERGLSLTQVSGMEGFFWLVIVLAEVPTGMFADSFGRRTSLVAASLFTSVAVLVFGTATSYPIVMLSYVVWGVGLTFQSGADSALTFESLKALGRERDYQRVAGVGWALFSFGIVCGLLLGAELASATSLQTPILVSAGISFAGIFVAAAMKEPNLPHGEQRLPYRQLVTQSARTAWQKASIRWILVASALLLATPNAAVVFSQPFLAGHDVSVSLFGVWQAPTRVAGVIGSLAAYKLSATFGFRRTLVGGFLLLGGSYAVLGGWDTVYAFVAIGAVMVVMSVLLPVVADYINQRIPSNQRATILSFRQLITSVAIAAIQPVQGFIADEVSLQATFWATSGFIFIVTPAALYAWLRADSLEKPH